MVISEIWVFGFVSLMITILGYFIKCQIERVMQKLDKQDTQYVDCRTTLTDRFADKRETKDTFLRVFLQLDSHEHRIDKLEKEIKKDDK